MMHYVGRKSKNILATTSTKTKFALLLFENDPLIDQISDIWLIRLRPYPNKRNISIGLDCGLHWQPNVHGFISANIAAIHFHKLIIFIAHSY